MFNGSAAIWNVDNIKNTLKDVVKPEKLMALSDQLTSSRARLAAVTMTFDDGGSIAEIEKRVMASAQRSRIAYFDAVDRVTNLALNAHSAFGSFEEAIGFQELINKEFGLGSASIQQQKNVMEQLTEAMLRGTLTAKNIEDIWETAPDMVQNIADYMNVPVERVQGLAAEGRVTADVVKNAMFAASDEIESKFDNMPITWGQVWTATCNKAIQITQPLLDAINLLANNMDIVGPIILGIAGAFLVFQMATEGVALATMIYQGAINFVSIGLGILRGNTAAASAAQYQYNAALMSCPLVWAIMLIMALVALFYAGVAAINKFAGTSISATGVICGTFAALGAFLINTFFVPLVNMLAAFGNFFRNFLKDPAVAIEALICDLVINCLSYLSTLLRGIESLINKIPGVQIDITSGLDSFIGDLEKGLEKVKDQTGWVEYYQGMDFMDYSDAAKIGYKFGEGIEDKLKNSLDFGLDIDSLYNSSAQTAENTAAMADSMSISEEDLAYMRDIAEREAINRFTTAEVKIDMTGMTNRIDSNVDLDGVLTTLTDGFAEAIEVAAEGVHM